MKKSIQIDDRLFSVFEIMHKHKGDTWNDVIAKMCGCKDYADYLYTRHIVMTNSIKRCNKTIDWIDDQQNTIEGNTDDM